MTDQLPFLCRDFFNAYARTSDPDTSVAAANWMKKHVTKREKEVYDTLKNMGAMTMEEVANWLKRPVPSVSPRFRPLANKNMIQPQRDIKGTPVTRPGASGVQRIVWEAQKEESDWTPLQSKTKTQRIINLEDAGPMDKNPDQTTEPSDT